MWRAPVDEHEIREKRYVEGEKLLFEVSKHVTTLSTGSILVMIALLEKLFKENVHWKLLILISFGMFMLSIMYAVNTMTGIGLALRESKPTGKMGKAFMLISFSAFAIGMLSLMIFGFKNL
jgi:hypothetical protein